MTDQQQNEGGSSSEAGIRFPLPDGVHFEVPRDYARFCNGHPVRVVSGEAPATSMLVTWAADVIRLAAGTVVVEYDLASVRGLLVNLAEPVTGMIASTIRVVFEGSDGVLASLLILSANPAYADSVRHIADSLSQSRAPVTVFSSMADVISQRG
jgi:hypothetical protein